MIASLSSTNQLAVIVLLFIVIVFVVAMGRSIFGSAPPRARRFRVGVFLERENEDVPGAKEDEEP